MTPIWDPYAAFKKYTLANGLTVHAHHWPQGNWQMVAIMVHSGAASDLPGLQGTAHFVEHMTPGSGVKDEEEMAIYCDNAYGEAEFGATDLEETDYSFMVPADREVVGECLINFGTMLLGSRIKGRTDRERKAILHEYEESYPTQIEFAVPQRGRKMAFYNTRFASIICPLGSTETIKKISRDDLEDYYNTHYVPKTMSIVTVGALQLEDIVRLIEESPFGTSKKPGERNALPDLVIPGKPLEPLWGVDLKHYLTKPTTAKYKSMGAIRTPREMFFTDVCEGVLKERFYRHIREANGWNYSFDIDISQMNDFTEFEIGSDSIDHEHTMEIHNLVDRCLAEAGEDADSFERFKRRAIGRRRHLIADAEEVVQEALRQLGTWHRIISVEETLDCLSSMRLPDACQVFGDITQQRWACIMTP